MNMKSKLKTISQIKTKNWGYQGVLTAKMLQYLDFTDTTKDMMGKFDHLFNKQERKWFRQPHDWSNNLLNGSVAKRGLGIPNVHDKICGCRLDRFLRFEGDNPYESNAQVEELKSIMKYPNYIKLDEKKEFL